MSSRSTNHDTRRLTSSRTVTPEVGRSSCCVGHARSTDVRGPHRGPHVFARRGVPRRPDPQFQAVSAWPKGSRWAVQDSNCGHLRVRPVRYLSARFPTLQDRMEARLGITSRHPAQPARLTNGLTRRSPVTRPANAAAMGGEGWVSIGASVASRIGDTAQELRQRSYETVGSRAKPSSWRIASHRPPSPTRIQCSIAQVCQPRRDRQGA